MKAITKDIDVENFDPEKMVKKEIKYDISHLKKVTLETSLVPSLRQKLYL